MLPDLALFVASVALIWWLGHVEVAERQAPPARAERSSEGE